MRIIKYCFFVLFFAQGCNVKSEFQDNTLVVRDFVEAKINQRTFDLRIFDPPPPPELQDSLKHQGRIKPDSIIKKLAPLQVYLNESITYDEVFKPKVKPAKGFEFINSNMKKGGGHLEMRNLIKKKEIILHIFSSDELNQLYESVNLQEGYAGFVSFKNLYYSEDGEKAYFEFFYFKRKLNSSTSVVYAEKQNDGTWKFNVEIVSIS